MNLDMQQMLSYSEKEKNRDYIQIVLNYWKRSKRI